MAPIRNELNHTKKNRTKFFPRDVNDKWGATSQLTFFCAGIKNTAETWGGILEHWRKCDRKHTFLSEKPTFHKCSETIAEKVPFSPLVKTIAHTQWKKRRCGPRERYFFSWKVDFSAWEATFWHEKPTFQLERYLFSVHTIFKDSASC
jgi:hypothetical protein